MAKGDKNYISIWSWLLIWFVMMIPLVNLIMMVVWAFYGDNESRKNYFRAWIVLALFWIVLMAILLALGFFPEIMKKIQLSTIKS